MGGNKGTIVTTCLRLYSTLLERTQVFLQLLLLKKKLKKPW